MIQPARPASFTTPCLGIDMVLFDETETPCDCGEVFLTSPSVGMSTALIAGDHRSVYYEGTPRWNGQITRRHGDSVERLGAAYYRVQGRADDAMNLGGIKVSSAEIERVLNTVEGVSETAAIAVEPSGGGPSQLVVYAVLSRPIEELQTTLQHVLRNQLNPLFKIADVALVDALPRTASNKVMRRVCALSMPNNRKETGRISRHRTILMFWLFYSNSQRSHEIERLLSCVFLRATQIGCTNGGPPAQLNHSLK